MKRVFQTLSLGSLKFFFSFDPDHKPVIEVQGNKYITLSPIVSKIPQLNQPQNFDKFAQIANFLAQGIEFQYIEDIEAFKKNYFLQLQEEQSLFFENGLLKEYGIFDLSLLHPPLLEDSHLVFFVKHDYLSIPYRVSLFYPFQEECFDIRYELLPLIP